MQSILKTFTRSSISSMDQSPTILGLKQEEVNKLTKFKEEIKEFNLPKALEEDEFYNLKWLTARGYNIEKAKEMLENHLDWRKNCIYLNPNQDYITPKVVYEQFRWKRLGNDPKGRPIFCLLGGKVDTKFLIKNKYCEDWKYYCHKALETIQGASDEQRRLTGFGKMILILDMEGFSLGKAMDMELVQMVMHFARTFEAQYPELLHTAIILNASWYFTTVYNIMKTFLAQETMSKIQVHGYDKSKYLSSLEEVVPTELIPVEYGGTGDSIEEFEDIP